MMKGLRTPSTLLRLAAAAVPLLAGTACHPEEKKEAPSAASSAGGTEVNSAAAPAAEEAAKAFYRLQLKLGVSGLPDEAQFKQLSPLLSTELQALITKARAEQAKDLKDHPHEPPRWADGDLFSSLFEGAQEFTLQPGTVTATHAELPVKLKHTEGGSTTEWQDLVILDKEGDGWKVSDILFKGEWAFKSGASLKEKLK